MECRGSGTSRLQHALCEALGPVQHMVTRRIVPPTPTLPEGGEKALPTDAVASGCGVLVQGPPLATAGIAATRRCYFPQFYVIFLDSLRFGSI
jgi:hypothetical protein